MNQTDLKLAEEGLINLKVDFTKGITETLFTEKGVDKIREILEDPKYKNYFYEKVMSSDLPIEELQRRLRIL